MSRDSESAEAGAAANDPLRLECCPACGYRLGGLPAEGTCPECGAAYDQSAVFLYGWARGEHVDFSNARPLHLIWPAVGIGFVLWSGWQTYRQFGSVTAFVCPGVLLVFAGLALLRRLTATCGEHPGLVQVRLDATGCAQIDVPSRHGKRGRVTRWVHVRAVELTPQGPGTVRLRVRTPPPLWRTVSYPIDAELRCTVEQANALRARLHAWRSAAERA